MKMFTDSELEEIKRKEFERGYIYGSENSQPLAPARGIINAIAFSVPVWIMLAILYFLIR